MPFREYWSELGIFVLVKTNKKTKYCILSCSHSGEVEMRVFKPVPQRYSYFFFANKTEGGKTFLTSSIINYGFPCL